MRVRSIVALFFSMLSAAVSSAHDVFPGQITLRPGGQDQIYVVDASGCDATITVSSPSPNLVKVAAVNMGTGAVGSFAGQVSVPNRVDQLFVVRAEPGITTSVVVALQVCWIGSSAPNPPCPENNCTMGAPVIVPVTIDLDPLSIAGSSFCGVIGDPVTTDDGELFFVEDPDFDLRGPMSLEFERVYISRGVSDGNVSSALGPNWLSNFDWKLASTGGNVEITTSSGRVIRFERAPFSTTWTLALYDEIPFQLVDIAADRVLGDPTTGYSYTFNSQGLLTKIADGHGNTHTLTHGASGPTSVTDGIGRTLSFTYSGGRLTSVGDGTRNVSFGYTGGQLTSATDADGKTTSYTYDPAVPGGALMTGRTLPNGNTPFTHVFDTSRRVSVETDALTNATTLSYDAATGETTVTDPLANTQVHDHTASAQLTGFEDEGGSTASMTYDAQGRRKSVTDKLGRTVSWTIHAPSGRIASMTEADGSTTSYGYTARTVGGLTFHDLTSIAYPGGTSEAFTYDASGNMTSSTDLEGEAWTHTYNSRGQLLTATDPEGGVTTLTYNADGTLATSKDAANNTTTFGYDALRRATLITRPDASTVAFTYDSLDRLLTLTDEESRTTTYGYDDNGNLVTVTDSSLKVWTLTYDALDRLTSVLDPEGNTASSTFDALGRVSTLTNGAGDTVTVGYNARGYMVSVEDGLLNTWMLNPDVEGIPVSLVDPANRTEAFTSDSRGRVTRATTPLGRSTNYTYDAHSRLTRITDPLGRAANYAYDARGALERVTLPVVGAVNATRDGTGHITEITYPGNLKWQFGFDNSGRMTSRTDPLGRTTSVTHDERNRVEQISFPGGLGSGLFAWNDANQLTDIDLSDGTSLHYDYDTNGRLIAAGSATFSWDDAGRMIDSNGIAIARDSAGRIQSVTYAPGKVVSYTYDVRGLLATIADWVGGLTTFTYDSAGRLMALSRPNGLTTRYVYDDDSRPIQISEVRDVDFGEIEMAVATATYNADDTIRQITNLPATSFLPSLAAIARTFDAAGQDTSKTHDDRGNVLVDGGDIHTWDLAGRLKTRTGPGGVDTFDYDAVGQVEVITGSNVAQFGRNYASGGVVQILRNGSGQDQQYVVTTPAGGIVHLVDANINTRTFYHFDFKFWTRRLSDDGGNVTDEYEHDPRGALLGHTGTSTQPFTVLGHYGVPRLGQEDVYLIQSGLYDAGTGLFLNPLPQRPFDARASNSYVPGPGTALNPALAIAGLTTSQIPRFVDRSPSTNRFAINPCLTNLLFPFVTNQSGFETGLSIANTTRDGFAGGASATVESPTASGTAGGWPTTGFQGYMVKNCNFQAAHGFAFFSDVGAHNLAQGYRNLILDNGRAPAESTAVPEETELQRSIRKWRAKFPPGKKALRITNSAPNTPQFALGEFGLGGRNQRFNLGWYVPVRGAGITPQPQAAEGFRVGSFGPGSLRATYGSLDPSRGSKLTPPSPFSDEARYLRELSKRTIFSANIRNAGPLSESLSN